MKRLYKEISKIIPDKTYLKLLFRYEMHKKLNIDNPQTYNEKLQWLKIHDRKPIYTKMVDKYEVKKYVSSMIGEEYIIPTIGVYEKWSDINFNQLPNQFVIKCTHDSGGTVICEDKSKLDFKVAKEKIEKSLHTNFYYSGREWPYKNVKPRIIVEKYMQNAKEKNNNNGLLDYKFFVFNGECKLMFIASDRQAASDTCFDFYDMDFQHLDIINGHPNSKKKITKPKTFNEMRQIAEKLGKNIPQIRVDFYEIDGQVYFGELTLFHWSGLVPFEPEEWDYKLGKLISLPKK